LQNHFATSVERISDEILHLLQKRQKNFGEGYGYELGEYLFWNEFKKIGVEFKCLYKL